MRDLNTFPMYPADRSYNARDVNNVLGALSATQPRTVSGVAFNLGRNELSAAEVAALVALRGAGFVADYGPTGQWFTLATA